MYSWNPYIYNQMPYNDNYDIDEDWAIDENSARNDNNSAPNVEPIMENVEPMMENVPMPITQPAPMMTMPAAYPETAPIMTMPIDCGCYPSYPIFIGDECWPFGSMPGIGAVPSLPMMDMGGTMPDTTFPMTEATAPTMDANIPPMQMPDPTSYPSSSPYMHGHFTPGTSHMTRYGYNPYYPYR
jgi:hypothetical protein